MTTDVAPTGSVTVADVVQSVDTWYPAATAESWDRVGLVVGEPDARVDRMLLAVDCVAETVDEAISLGAQMMITHHPLLLRGVHSVATTTYKGALVHRLIRHGIALLVAHTNADSALPGVTDALAVRLGLVDVLPLRPGERHPGRIGRLETPVPLSELGAYVAGRLPVTAGGIRVAGDPDRRITTLALAGGAGDSFLAEVTAAGVDAYLTADLRHHPASEHLAGGGPALLDAAHWATERPWLDVLGLMLKMAFGMPVHVSNVVTDVWTMLALSPSTQEELSSISKGELLL
jgi:dinuclear metal center YbgI/SA1388 family protein